MLGQLNWSSCLAVFIAIVLHFLYLLGSSPLERVQKCVVIVIIIVFLMQANFLYAFVTLSWFNYVIIQINTKYLMHWWGQVVLFYSGITSTTFFSDYNGVKI